MTDAATTARDRLDRLEGFLREDPNNVALLAEAFDTALRSAEWPRAEFHLRHLEALQPDQASWPLRRADLLIAQRRWTEAEAVLNAMPWTTGTALHQAVTHSHAVIAFLQGDFPLAERALAPVCEVPPATPLHPATQLLWLRTLHRTGSLDRALAWARERNAAMPLEPEVLGAASLVALDADELPLALRWADAALASGAAPIRPMEALVARASLALAQRDIEGCLQLAEEALKQNVTDGRTWSIHAFGEMLRGHADQAKAEFQQALKHMPTHVGTWHGLGWIQLVGGDLAAAAQAFREAVSLDRGFAESHGALRWSSLCKGSGIRPRNRLNGRNGSTRNAWLPATPARSCAEMTGRPSRSGCWRSDC